MPSRTDDDIKLLIVYVLLSRVRSLANLRSIGITSQIRKIIEAGPPSMLAENVERLFRTKITTQKQQQWQPNLHWAGSEERYFAEPQTSHATNKQCRLIPCCAVLPPEVYGDN